jgi:hypothetical protein
MEHLPRRPDGRAATGPRGRNRQLLLCRPAALLVASLASIACVAGQHPITSSTVSRTETLLGTSSVPGGRVARTTRPVEVGLRFSVTVPGSITGVRYFATRSSRAGRTGSLWTGSGSRLATVRFSRSAATGWRSAAFRHAVHVVPGRTYVVSYYAPRGRYAVQRQGLRTRLIRGHLRAAKDSGVYRFGRGDRFPDHPGGRSNFLVDVTFVSAPGPTQSRGTAVGGFPTESTAGLPSHWSPSRTVTGDLWIRKPGAVLKDVRVVEGTIHVAAPNVTLLRVQGQGAFVQNVNDGSCSNGLLIADSTFSASGRTSDTDPPVIGMGGYTLRNSVIVGAPEGARVGATDVGCGPVTVKHSFIHVQSPTSCTDWHGDALQGYGGAALTVRKSVLVLSADSACGGGTAPLFYPAQQGNTSLHVDGLVVEGGGYPFRDGMPGSVRGLYVVKSSWVFAPVLVDSCDVLTFWDAHVATLNSAGEPVPGRTVSCSGP